MRKRARDVDVVVAHPDDEALWLCAAVERAASVIVCFPSHATDRAITRGWERARMRSPYEPPKYLPLVSAGIFDLAGDGSPTTPRGVGLAETSERTRRYVDNFDRLLPLLRKHLSGADVYTHNPWGEYGHYEHVQVCRAVVAVAVELGASVWCWAGTFSWEGEKESTPIDNHLVAHYRSRVERLPRCTLSGDPAAFLAIRQAYVSTGSWTGPTLYLPPEEAEMIQLVNCGRPLLELD
jgi:LmbE family N-acetylglucosaminyl deacetylase